MAGAGSESVVPRGLAAMIQLVAQAREGESQGDVWWTSNLWTVVASMVRRGELAPGLVTALEAHGYGGGDPARAGVPDLATLKQTLATMGATVETTPVAQAPQQWSAGSRYAQDLPAELRRVGPEIYRNLRKFHVSARDWLKQYYPDSTTAMGTQWVDLWGAAMAVDLRLQQSARAEGWAGVQETLATDDLVESHLRRLEQFRLYANRASRAAVQPFSIHKAQQLGINRFRNDHSFHKGQWRASKGIGLWHSLRVDDQQL